MIGDNKRVASFLLMLMHVGSLCAMKRGGDLLESPREKRYATQAVQTQLCMSAQCDQATQYEEQKEPDVCGICLMGDRLIQTVCNHHYHDACLAEWLKQSDTCPSCRKRLVDAAAEPVFYTPVVQPQPQGVDKAALRELARWRGRLHNLRDLINNNQIPPIVDGVLDLSDMALGNVMSLSAIPAIETVTTLNLLGNNFFTIPKGAFRVCANLKKLAIMVTALIKIERGSFDGLSRLEEFEVVQRGAMQDAQKDRITWEIRHIAPYLRLNWSVVNQRL